MLKVSKLDAAQRQLDCAIRLWFNDEDAVAITTLTFAAYQIIQDINEKEGDKGITLKELTRLMVGDERLEEVMRMIKKPRNFFKHAENDPHDILEFYPDRAEVFILASMTGLAKLGERISDYQKAFHCWQNIHHNFPMKTLDDFFHNEVPPAELETFRTIPKKEFLNGLMSAMSNSRNNSM